MNEPDYRVENGIFYIPADVPVVPIQSGWKRERMYSLRMINWHFWLATLGIVFYAASMWVSGITQGLMWREYGPDGYLVHSFADTVAAIRPMFIMRAFGGVLYLYVRGMCGAETPTVDRHPAGVFSWSPPAALVTALSDLLDGRLDEPDNHLGDA